MRRFLPLVLVLGIVAPVGTVMAQGTVYGITMLPKADRVDGKVLPLEKLNIHPDSCGPYFKYFQSKEDPRANAFVVVFIGNNKVNVRFVGNEKMNVEIVGGKVAPKARFRLTNGEPDGVVVEISQNDFANAPCLKRAMVKYLKQAH
jgi:hypothetical protein